MDDLRHVESDIHLRSLLVAHEFGTAVIIAQHTPFTLPNIQIILTGSLGHLLAHVAHTVPCAVSPIAVSANEILHVCQVTHVGGRAGRKES